MGLNLCFSHLPRALLAAPPAADPTPLPIPQTSKSLHMSIAVIIGVLAAMFSLTFLLLLYTKHCKGQDGGGDTGGPGYGVPVSSPSGRRNSGVDRSVVEILPVFRFGSLLGQKEGLECAVCLARFVAAEALRLLPKCRHAFHVECVDTWLDAHSSCPLCRARVDPEDVLLLPDQPELTAEPNGGRERGRESVGGEAANPTGRRFSGRHSSVGEKSSKSLLGVVVDRAEPKSRKSVDCAALRAARAAAVVGCLERERERKDGLLPTDSTAGGVEGLEGRFSHQIVVSGGGGGDEVARERWSDLRPLDLLFLRSDMIITGSRRLSGSRAGGDGSGDSGVISQRSLSEIGGVSRFTRRAVGEARQEAEERAMRRWLGFAATRTTRWLEGRESGAGPYTRGA